MKRFGFYGSVSAAVAAVAALVVALVPVSETNRTGAWLGVALATAAGGVALLLKRWAMSTEGLESITAGMKTLAGAMVVRAALLVGGLVWMTRTDGAAGFVCGFFGVYLGQQWLEISYLLDAQRQHSALRKMETR